MPYYFSKTQYSKSNDPNILIYTNQRGKKLTMAKVVYNTSGNCDHFHLHKACTYIQHQKIITKHKTSHEFLNVKILKIWF